MPVRILQFAFCSSVAPLQRTYGPPGLRLRHLRLRHANDYNKQGSPISVDSKPYVMCIVALLAAACLAAQWAAADSPPVPETRTIGILEPKTGSASTAVQTEALMLALAEFNRYLSENGADWRLDVVERDTKSDPSEALRLVQELDGMGIKAIIGPATSSSVREIKEYADANGMVVVSFTSSAADLSIPHDAIFRTIPDAKNTALAMHAQMRHDGINEIITIFRDDSVGRSVNHTLYETIADGSGNMSVRDSIKFAPDMADVSAIVSEIKGVLSAAPPVTDYGGLGIVIFDFGLDIVNIVHGVATSGIYGMNETSWYGPGHRMDEMASNNVTRSFLAATDYKTFVRAHTENALNIWIDSMINGADAYSYSAYDALFILGNAIHMAGNATDGDAIAAAIPVAARAGHGPDQHMHVKGLSASGSLYSYAGAIGTSVELNEAGDLAVSDYHIRSIVDDAFEVTHRYASATDGILEFTPPEERRVGVLVSETGPLAPRLGIPASKAVSLAAYNYNLDLANSGADWRLDIAKKDDRTHPQTTLEMTQAFHADGILALLGPVSSGSASAILDYVNDNDMVAISYGSASPALALPDNMFRMRVSDEHSAKAYAGLLEHDGIATLVIVHRNDTWGASLNQHITGHAEERGGITILPSVEYAAAAPDGPATDYYAVVQTLKSRLAGVDMSDTAVMLFGFDEVWDVIGIAAADPGLQDGRWYAYLASPDLELSPRGASWLEKVGFTIVITQHVGNDISDYIDANVPGSNVFSYHAYDALYVMADAMERVGADSNAGELGAAIPAAAMNLSSTAVGFPVELTADGDLAGSDYAVYRVEDGVFKLTALYDSDAGVLEEPAPSCSRKG